ncbi:hypothetical protein ACLB1T_29320 [Escherichia coli]
MTAKFYWRNWRDKDRPGAVFANGINRFPAVTKLFQGFAYVPHRRLVAACEVFQIHHDTGDIAVVLRLANGVDDIKQ